MKKRRAMCASSSARVAKLLGDAPVVESEGRAYPVETRYAGRDSTALLERHVAEVTDEDRCVAGDRARAEDAGAVDADDHGALRHGRSSCGLAHDRSPSCLAILRRRTPARCRLVAAVE